MKIKNKMKIWMKINKKLNIENETRFLFPNCCHFLNIYVKLKSIFEAFSKRLQKTTTASTFYCFEIKIVKRVLAYLILHEIAYLELNFLV